MPRSTGRPPAPNSSLITSFFTRIDQSHQSFHRNESTADRNTAATGERQLRESSFQPSISAATSTAGSFLDTILREPFHQTSTIPQRRAFHDVVSGSNDDASVTPADSNLNTSTTVETKRPRRALTSSFTLNESSTSRAKAKKQPSRNLVHALANRSLTGKLRSSPSLISGSSWRRKMNWCQASTLRIPLKTSTSTKIVNALAFDNEGSLLAVAHGRAEISIYDWQSIRLTTRRNATETSAAECLPILQFKVGPFSVPIALVAWNPFHEDEIAIGLRATGSIFIMDLQVIQGWLEDQPPYGSSSMPPCSELRCFETGPRDLPGNVGGAVINQSSCFEFVDEGRVALLSAGATVFCWRLPASGSSFGARVSPLWRYQHSEMIGTMAVLSSQTIVLGGVKGSITILNWKKTQSNAFSSKPTPTIHATLDPIAGIKYSSFHAVRLMTTRRLTGDFYRLAWLHHSGRQSSLTVCLDPKSCETVFDKPKSDKAPLAEVVACGLGNKETIVWKASELLRNNGDVENSESRTIHDDRILRPAEHEQAAYHRGRSALKHWSDASKTCSSQSFHVDIGRGKPIAIHPTSEYMLVVEAKSDRIVVLTDRVSPIGSEGV